MRRLSFTLALPLLLSLVLSAGGCHWLLGLEGSGAARDLAPAVERPSAERPPLDDTRPGDVARPLDDTRPGDVATPSDGALCAAAATTVTRDRIAWPPGGCPSAGNPISWTHSSPCCTPTQPCLLVVTVAAYDAGGLDLATVTANGSTLKPFTGPLVAGRAATSLWYGPLAAPSAAVEVKVGKGSGVVITKSATYLRADLGKTGAPTMSYSATDQNSTSYSTSIPKGLVLSSVATDVSVSLKGGAGTTAVWATTMAGPCGSGATGLAETASPGGQISVSWEATAATSWGVVAMTVPYAP